MAPVVVKVAFDLSCQRLGQWLVICESGEKHQPVMKVAAFVHYSHFLLVVTDDFDKVAHNIREEGYTAKHNNHSNNSFIVTDRIVISIADCAECGQCVVTAYYQLVGLILAFKLKILYESVLLWQVLVERTEEEPEAANEVCDYYCNYDESEYLIDVDDHILRDYLFVSRLVAHERLQHFLKLGNINELDQSWQPKQAEQLGYLACWDEELERKHRYEVHAEPTFEHVVLGDHFDVSDDD